MVITLTNYGYSFITDCIWPLIFQRGLKCYFCIDLFTDNVGYKYIWLWQFK